MISIGYIYLFTNKVNNKKYIGQTWNYERRIGEHYRGYGYAKLLKNAIDKYGKENLEVKILYESLCTQEILDKLETNFIKEYNTLAPYGYNLDSGGSNCRRSESTKLLIGSYHKNKIVSEETRKKISEKLMNRTVSLDTREKISNTRKCIYNNIIKPIYIFNCFTHDLIIEFKNSFELKENIEIPSTRIFGSISS